MDWKAKLKLLQSALKHAKTQADYDDVLGQIITLVREHGTQDDVAKILEDDGVFQKIAESAGE